MLSLWSYLWIFKLCRIREWLQHKYCGWNNFHCFKAHNNNLLHVHSYASSDLLMVCRTMQLIFLKEKLPQAFMQIGWMEEDFRNLTAKVWTNLDIPIKKYDFSMVSLILCMSPSQVCTILIYVMSQQYNCLMELYTHFTKFYFSWRYIFPLLLYLGMLGLRWMCMNLWMNLIKRTIDIQENCEKFMYKVSGELYSCDITYSGRVQSREGDTHNFA